MKEHMLRCTNKNTVDIQMSSNNQNILNRVANNSSNKHSADEEYALNKQK